MELHRTYMKLHITLWGIPMELHRNFMELHMPIFYGDFYGNFLYRVMYYTAQRSGFF
jgi:hypothetical protein